MKIHALNRSGFRLARRQKGTRIEGAVVSAFVTLGLVAPIAVLLFVLSGCEKSPEGDQPKATSEPDLSTPVSEGEAKAFPLEPLARTFETKWLVPLWDRLRAKPNQLDALNQQDVFWAEVLDAVRFVGFGVRSERSHDMVEMELIPVKTAAIGSQIAKWREQGVEVGHSDWHQESIRRVGDAMESVVRFNIHAVQADRRIRIKGQIAVNWLPGKPERPEAIRWLKGTLTERRGEPAFVRVTSTGTGNRNPDARMTLGGLAVYDLNADTLPDIAIASANVRFMNRGEFQFETEPLSYALAENRETLQSTAR